MGCRAYPNDRDYYDGFWASVGYPAELSNPGVRFTIVEESVKIVDVDDEGSEGKELETHVFSLGGWSDGPLWAFVRPNDPHAIGVLSDRETGSLQPRHSLCRWARYGGARQVRREALEQDSSPEYRITGIGS